MSLRGECQLSTPEQSECTYRNQAPLAMTNLFGDGYFIWMKLVVLEATGGFEMLAVAQLSHAKLPVVVSNARRVREFAHATGRLAKTDKLDAKVLAHFAAAVRPPVRALRSEEEEQLTACMRKLLVILNAMMRTTQHWRQIPAYH